MTLTSSDTSEATVPATITIPAGQATSAPFDIDAVDDAIVDGTQTVTITAAATAHSDGTDTLDVADDSIRGVTVSTISGETTESGDSATFTVVLTTIPTADVTIGVSSDDTSEGTVSPTSFTFTPANWNIPQTVTVTGVDDSEADGDVSFNVVLAAAVGGDYAGIDPPDVSVTNLDNEGPALDVDGNTNADAATDGILIIRYLFGFRGDPLITGAVAGTATRTTSADIEAALDTSLATLDADGNGVRDAATDGILIIRYLFGFRGDSLVEGAVGAGATRTTGPEVAAFLDGFLPLPPAAPNTTALKTAPTAAPTEFLVEQLRSPSLFPPVESPALPPPTDAESDNLDATFESSNDWIGMLNL